LFIGQTDVKSPSDFCTSHNALRLTEDQLESLSLANLDAPIFTVCEENYTAEQLGMHSQTNPVAFSSMNYDLNLTIEENEMNLRGERGS